MAEILDAADGRVVVRLLDAPRHEFGGPVEHNPMLGVRGVRSAILDERLTRLLLGALASAAADHVGGSTLEVMVPMVALPAELELVRSWIVEEFAAHGVDGVKVGVMIETPRAALCADRLAAHADFFSIGSNDLTQLTYGLEPRRRRGHRAARLPRAGRAGGQPVRVARRRRGRAAHRARPPRPVAPRTPSSDVGLCGEHGGDPTSIATARAPRPRPRVVLGLPGAGWLGSPRPTRCWPTTRRSQARPPARASWSADGHRRRRRAAGPGGIRHRGGRQPAHAAARRSAPAGSGLCPFHNEKSASFSVNQQLGLYYCFGCRVKGDVITFVREIEHLDFVGAVEWLADQGRHHAPLHREERERESQATRRGSTT